MKRILLSFISLAFLATGAQAQWLRVWQNGESTRYAISNTANIPYTTAGSTLTIGDESYSTAEIDSITIIYPVTITWNGNAATVDIPENAEGVTAEVTGANVVINNTNTYAEQEFILQGTTDNGSLTYNGEYKAKFHLNGVHITNTAGSALDIECGKRIDVILEDGTTSSLADSEGGLQKAAFYCKGHMEVSGSGALDITGNSKHALSTKEYLFLKKNTGAITIKGAAGDGIHCGEYFQMNGGTLTFENITSDGLQVETANASDEELNGQFIMNDGSIQMTISNAGTKGIRLDAASTNTEIIPLMTLAGGDINIEMATTATDCKGIASDGDLTVGTASDGPSITVNMLAQGYLDGQDKIRSTGIKVGQSDEEDDYGETGNFLLQGGDIVINATGDYSRGMNTNNFTATGGHISVISVLTAKGVQGIKYAGKRTYNASNVTLTNCNWK